MKCFSKCALDILRLVSGRPARRENHKWPTNVEAVESRCLLSGVTASAGEAVESVTPLGDPSEVFTPTEPGPGNILQEELLINEWFYNVEFGAMMNGVTLPDNEASVELPAALTVQEVIEQAGQLGVEGLPFTTGAPLLVIPIGGPEVGGVILTGQAEGGLNQQGVIEATGTITFGIVGAEQPVTWPDWLPLPDGSLQLGLSETISGSIPDGETTNQLNIGVNVDF